MSQGDKNSATREALLTGGREVLTEHGYNDATVRLITQAAGRAHGTFYLHFESKEDLYATLLRELHASLHARGRSVWNPSDPISSVRSSINQFLDAYEFDRPLRQLLDGGSALSPRFQEVRSDLRTSLANDIHKGMKSIESYTDLGGMDPWMSAHLLASMLEGACARLFLYEPMTDKSDLADHLTAMWVRMLGIELAPGKAVLRAEARLSQEVSR